MEEELYYKIIETFNKNLSKDDYRLRYNEYEYYITKQNKADKRKRYFNIFIDLNNLTRFNTYKNAEIIGNALLQVSKIMNELENNDDKIMFKDCIYSEEGYIVIKFNTLKTEVKRKLTNNISFSVNKY